MDILQRMKKEGIVKRVSYGIKGKANKSSFNIFLSYFLLLPPSIDICGHKKTDTAGDELSQAQ